MKSAHKVSRQSFIQLLILTILMSGIALAGIVWSRTSSAQNSPTCATAPSGLVAWYQGAGNTDDNAGGNNGTPQGNVTYVAGEVGQAFNFDADQSAVAVGNPTQLQLQDLTIEAWIKRSSATRQPPRSSAFTSRAMPNMPFPL